MAEEKEKTNPAPAETPTEAKADSGAAPTPQAAAPAPKKGMSTTAKVIIGIVVGVVLLAMILPMIGALGVGFFVAKNIKNNGNNITIGSGKDSISVSTDEQNQVWPNTIPANIPKFTAGKIKASGKFGTTWTLTISDVNQSDYDIYKAKLVASGWKIDADLNIESVVSYTATKDTWHINPMYTPAEKSMVLGINQYDTSSTQE